MYRYWNLSLMICFSVSVMFVGSENTEFPPPKNLNFLWETPFRLSLTWEEPEDLDSDCKVNYTVHVYESQDCSNKDLSYKTYKVSHLSHTVNVSNKNGLCISVATYPENCRDRGPESRPTTIILPPPPVRLVTDLSCGYSHSRMKCTWKPGDDVQDLGFYYWLPVNESIIKCTPDGTMKTGGCIIDNRDLNTMMEIYYLFNGTRNGVPVNNTFEGVHPLHCVKLNKPQLTIHRVGQELYFQTTESDLKEFDKDCYTYQYTYTKCNKNVTANDKMKYIVQFDPACKYRARVQILFSKSCGSGGSDPSDEVEYGENSDPRLPAFLAVIIIPLIVSCCLIVSLVLLRRHKDIIFPKIPEPTLLFKGILINNIRTSEDILRSPAAVRLYVPAEEIVESRISLEPDTPFIPSMNNVPHEPK